jgi:hypothetical protein
VNGLTSKREAADPSVVTDCARKQAYSGALL